MTKKREALQKFIRVLSKVEDYNNMYSPSYLKLDESEDAANYCERHCPYEYDEEFHCAGYGCKARDIQVCENQQILSAGNRLIGAVIREGYRVLPIAGITEGVRVNPLTEAVFFNWGGEEEEEFCRRCRAYGTERCPEDLDSPMCARHYSVNAIERITEAVNELL